MKSFCLPDPQHSTFPPERPRGHPQGGLARPQLRGALQLGKGTQNGLPCTPSVQLCPRRPPDVGVLTAPSAVAWERWRPDRPLHGQQGSYPRWASSPSPQAPGSKYRSLTAEGGHGTPASDIAFLSSPLESHPYHPSLPNPQCSDPLALIFNDLNWEVGFQRGLNLSHFADDFPEVKGFWFSRSSTTKPCSYLLHWISSQRWETLNSINGTSLLQDIK